LKANTTGPANAAMPPNPTINPLVAGPISVKYLIRSDTPLNVDLTAGINTSPKPAPRSIN